VIITRSVSASIGGQCRGASAVFGWRWCARPAGGAGRESSADGGCAAAMAARGTGGGPATDPDRTFSGFGELRVLSGAGCARSLSVRSGSVMTVAQWTRW
jgi:hypothetical protein